MKKITLLITAILFSTISFCQASISIDSLSSYMGDSVTVCSKVYGTRYLEQSEKQPTFLNIGAAYPNSLLTIVIFGESRKNFKNAPEDMYADKSICITGRLAEFKGKAEIIVYGPGQIKIQ